MSVASDDESATFVVAHDADIAIGPNRVGLSGPAWEGVELTEVSVAALEPGSDELPLAWRHFHVFLPDVRALSRTRFSSTARSAPTSPVSTSASRPRRATTTATSSARPRGSSRAELLPILRARGTEAVLAALDRGDHASR